MNRRLLAFLCLGLLETVSSQVIQFGECFDVKTVKYFDLERFLGDWYEIERYPTWYEKYGRCAFKRIQNCGRRLEIQHVFVKDGIQYVLHVNSTFKPGDEAVFTFYENNIDPVGTPLSVIATNYEDYAVVVGCKYDNEINIKYGWILSRERTLSEQYSNEIYTLLNSIQGLETSYLEKVEQDEERCSHQWTAHVQAENITLSIDARWRFLDIIKTSI